MSQSLVPTTQLPVITDSLERYLQEISRIPVLDANEEQALARRLRDQQDLEAAQRLVISHLRFVVHIARSYQGYGLPIIDLVQEGNIGLMKAVKRFDPDQNVRLVSFAVHWIRAEIHEYILRNWRIVKVATTKAQRKLFFRLRSWKKNLGWLTAEETSRMADDLGVPEDTVREMESRMSGQDLGFELDADDDEGTPHAPATYLQSPEHDPARRLEHMDDQQHQLGRLQEGMARLDDRSRDIIRRRWLSDNRATLHDLADEYGVSAERIRQIEKSAMKKVRHCIDA